MYCVHHGCMVGIDGVVCFMLWGSGGKSISGASRLHIYVRLEDACNSGVFGVLQVDQYLTSEGDREGCFIILVLVAMWAVGQGNWDSGGGSSYGIGMGTYRGLFAGFSFPRFLVGFLFYM